MPLKYQLTAEEYAQLDEAKQALYALQGDVYICQIEGLPQQEDVSGLKRQRDGLLAEKKAEQERRRQAELERQRQGRADLQRSIEQRDINLAATRIATAIADGDNADILKDFIARRLKVAEGQVRVTDDSGNLTVSSIADLQKEFENASRYASLVCGSQAGGGPRRKVVTGLPKHGSN
ncbi:hypothetical protein [Dryocola sp. BD586]|uniref:hypothetical protein n=1 Tax=Dryocola sp. BD586 TaxID=3133271 RepID=UPI003F4FE9C1